MSRFVLTAQLQLQAPNNVSQVVRQIQNQLNGVTVNVQVQGAPQAQRQIQQITNQTNQATSAATRMGRAFAVSIRRFAAFSIATRAVGLFTSTLSDAIQTSIDFERQLIKVSQVTGKSVGQLSDLTREITRLSTGLGVSSQSLLDVSTILAQAGLTANDTKTALNALAKAALAPNFDSITETAEGAIAILAQFKQGVGALEGQLGSINAVAGAFAVEASDLIDVIRRTGGVFKSSGGSLNELLALFTSVRATTRESAESIGTGLRTIFTRIQRPKTIEYLKQFGVELIDLEGKFVGPFEAVRKLSTALAGLGEGDVTFIRIAEELGGFRQIGKVLPLLQQFSTAQAALSVATKANNSLSADAASAQAALAIKIMKVKEEFLSLVRSITETSTFQVMANTALQLASALIKIADAVKPLLPLLGALAAIKIARGFGSFIGAVGGGLASTRTFNKGGKVHKFARGGLVPGSGNRDTVPAMLSPGEFVIRKSSVNKLGTGTLAAMNENRFAVGGTAEKIAAARADKNASGTKKPTKDIKSLSIKTPKFGTESEVGIATTSYLPSPATSSITVDRAAIVNQSIGDLGFKLSTKYGKNALSYINQVYKGKPKLSYRATAEGVGADEESKFKTIIDESISSSVDIASSRFAKEVLGSNLSTPVPKLPSFYQTLDQGFRGQLFENVISAMSGKPLSGQDSRRPFDFTRGVGKFKSIYSNLGMNYVDAKITSGAAGVGSRGFGTEGITGLTGKILGQLAKEAIPSISLLERQAGQVGTLTTQGKKNAKHFGGLIQKFAIGGGVRSRAMGSTRNKGILPRPEAVEDLIKSGGGYVDLDRAIKRTIGDKAYARAKTEEERQAVLNKFFLDPVARMKDVREASLTAFGSQLQSSIKSGRLQGSRIRLITKSTEVKGLRAYLSSLLGIPSGNMHFTSGGSKVPYMRNRGPLIDDIPSNARFATGGTVGTDTVPALLTPGEFVINKKSAQSIGYGALGRMNKVGRYATGGIVQRFMYGGTAQMPDARTRYGSGFVGSGGLGSSENFIPADMLRSQAKSLAQAQATLTTSTQRTSRGMMDVVSSNKMFAASMATSLLQGFLPAVDENSGTILKLSHGMLSLATTIASVGFALEAFGLQLNSKSLGSMFDLLSGKGGKFASRAGTYARLGAEQIPGLAKFGPEITTATRGLVKFAGSLAGVTLAVYSINTIFKALFDQTAKLNKAIELGDVDGAKKAAGSQVNLEGANMGTSAGAIIGLIVGGPIGAAIGAGVGRVFANLPIASYLTDAVSELFGGKNRASAIALADAQANASKTTKAFEQRTKDSTQIMKELEDGSISATEALKRLAASGSAQMIAQSASYDRAIAAQEGSKSGMLSGFGRGALRVGTLGIAGLMGVESGAGRNERIDREIADTAKQRRAFRNQNFESLRGNISQSMRENIYRGRSESDVYTTISNATRGPDGARQILTPTELKQQRANLEAQRQAAEKSGNKQQAETISLDIAQIDDEISFLENSFKNLSIEIELARKKFAAINLGFRTVSANSEAAALRLGNFVANLEVGAVPAQQAVATLEASLTKAGQAISANEVNGALDEVSGVFRQFGASEAEVTKFRENVGAAAAVQRNFPTIFENIKRNLQSQDLKGMDASSIGDVFKKEVAAQLDASGVGEDVRNRILDSMGEIDQDIIDAIDRGDYDKLGETLEGVSQEASKVMQEIVDNYAKIHQQLIDLTKRRIEAERNYIEAQKEALSIQMEARELQGKYGGKAVTNAERQANVIARANAGAEGMRLSNLQGGGVDQLRRRNNEIRQQFAGIEGKRTSEGGMAGTQGVIDDATQADLEKASKDQISTIRELIKIQEDELRIIQEKNKLEKDSLDALIAGDVDKFFEQQAAVGATAAIATGNQTLMNQFGAKALGGAYTDIQRQQEAGVQELYGVRLAGAGGLTERAAGASLAARGVTDPRAAQMAARTTAEEEKINANIRGLSNELADAGQVQADLALMKLKTAAFNVEQAEIKLAGGDVLKVGGPSTPATSGGTGGTGGAATTNAASTAAAGTTGRRAGGGGAGGASGGGGGRVADGVTGMSSGSTKKPNVAAAGEPLYGTLLENSPTLAAAAGLSNFGKLGSMTQSGTNAVKSGVARFGIGRSLEKAGYAATAGESNAATLGRFTVKSQNAAKNLPSNLLQQYNNFQSGRQLAKQGLSPSTEAGKFGAVSQRLFNNARGGIQNFKSGYGLASDAFLGTTSSDPLMARLGEKTGNFVNRAKSVSGNVLKPFKRFVPNNLIQNFKAGFAAPETIGTSGGFVNKLGGSASDMYKPAQSVLNKAKSFVPSVSSVKEAGSFFKTGFQSGPGTQALNTADSLGMGARGLYNKTGSALQFAKDKLPQVAQEAMKYGDDVLKTASPYIQGITKAASPYLKGATAIGGSLLKRLSPVASIADIGIGAYSGFKSTGSDKGGDAKNKDVITNTLMGALTGSAETGKSVVGGMLGIQQNSGLDAAMAGWEAMARGATVGATFGGAPGAVIGAGVGGVAESAKQIHSLALEEHAAAQAEAKTRRMTASSIDSSGLNSQERAWAKEQAMRENQLASATSKGDQSGISKAQKDLKDLEALRVRERTAGDWLPSMLTGGGTDSQEYQKYVEEQKASQQAQAEAAKQQETQAKATAEAAASPMSAIPPVSLVSPERANELLNQSGTQAMQVSQSQPSRASQQTLGGGSITNQAAGTTTPIDMSMGGGIDPEIVNKLMTTLDKFNVDLSANIDKLANTNFSVKLDATNINVNLSGGDFLSKLTKDVQQAVLQEVSSKLQNASIGNDGKLKFSSGSLPGSPSAPTSTASK